MTRSPILLLALPLVLSACALPRITAEPPGRHQVGDAYVITTSQRWTRGASPGGEMRTIDGFALGRLQTWAGLGEGESLAAAEGRTLPAFRADFTAIEAAELVADTIEALSTGADVEVTDLRPAPFGSRPGFRFSYRYLDGGLPTRGMALGAVHDGRLDLILFAAPAEYYFDLYQPEVERIMTTVTAPI
jgi:hypothetical protein